MITEWKWFGFAGHFICASDCRFHLCTVIGEHVISTVGAYVPRSEKHETKWREVGCDRTFETMVFKLDGFCTSPDCNCGHPKIIPSELDFAGYNDAGAATAGHLEMCRKWDGK